MDIIALRHPHLNIDRLTVDPGQRWCFWGTARSGINEFLALLEGRLSDWSAERYEPPDSASIISFAIQQDIFEEELRNDDSDFLDRPDPGTLVREFLPDDMLASELIDTFAMRGTLDTGYRQLSSGQSRKLLLLRAILGGAATIVIDSPYDGLDQMACRELDRVMSQLGADGPTLLVMVRNHQDIPSWCDHLALFDTGMLVTTGLRAPLLATAEEMAAAKSSAIFTENPLSQKQEGHLPHLPDRLVTLRNGFASYGTTAVFTNLDLSIDRGQHTLVTGPNGCGKSTLIHILTGDNPKCYANDLTIFGIRRGSGESIWEIKQHMGIVSPELHRSYRVPGSALQVVLSGLFDSIGLYQQVSAAQTRLGRRWLAAIDMGDRANTAFRSLSYGDQRLVLIARALIKEPPLLVLDEPTQGLDNIARRSLLDFLENVSRAGHTTILYVSHRQDEYRAFFRQHLQLARMTGR